MIKPRELRGGNWVNFIDDGVDFQVLEIKLNNPERHSTINGLLLDWIQPIPLTEEWLLRMGFTIVPAPSAYGFDCNNWSEKYLLRGAWNGKSWFAYEILNNGTHKEIRFVHELQNLFFAILGTELTIKG